ncbi:hypothetical protein [Streptomyces sp. SID4982]|uniref:hypothetical protein n=1 Tax=Streptomyces sp. SID4982 TaxID=2690291 RepID=UPI00136C5AC0|nr:hypothetical protein [Streptomyces sp. SID4982]MYS14996.1 hypothetical protein [Streptomyces sp. SID4982]
MHIAALVVTAGLGSELLQVSDGPFPRVTHGSGPGADQPCSECNHLKCSHQDGDDPVTPGLCLQCEAEESDEAHHDYWVAAPRPA